MRLIIGLSSINKMKDIEGKNYNKKGEEKECQRETSNGLMKRKDSDLSRAIMETIFLSITVPYRREDSRPLTKASE
jgi:hypothetical protein